VVRFWVVNERVNIRVSVVISADDILSLITLSFKLLIFNTFA